MMVKSESRSVATRAIDDPATLATLNEAELRLVMAACIETAAAAYKQWVGGSAVTQANGNSDRLLTTGEIYQRLGCSMQTLLRGAKAGKYPFMFKNGALWVGSEDGLERWIKARTRGK